MFVAKSKRLKTLLNKQFHFPHVFVVLVLSLIIASILTFIVPSGQYDRTEVTTSFGTQTLVIPGSYHTIEKETSWVQFFGIQHHEGLSTASRLLTILSAIPKGLVESADIIFCIFIVGGLFGVLKELHVIDDAINILLHKFQNRRALLSGVVIISLSIGGATYGLSEEVVPLVPVFVGLATRMGYNRIYAMMLICLSPIVGCAAGITNPFNVLIAQRIAQLPLYSGMKLRLLFYVSCMALTLWYIFRYGKKVYKPVEKHSETKLSPTASRTKTIVITCLLIYAGIIYGVVNLGWDITEMAGGFLLMIAVVTLIGRLSWSRSAHSFTKGMEEMVLPAVVIGFARAIVVIMRETQVLDSMIHFIAVSLENTSAWWSAEGMLIFQALLNLLIPSGSGQAAVTMPLMAPLSDLLGVTRQTAVLAFQAGDGFSNMLIPTSGMLLAMLSLAGVKYTDWIRVVLPLFALLMLLASLFLMIAVGIHYQ